MEEHIDEWTDRQTQKFKYLVIEKVIKVQFNDWNDKTPKHLRHGQSLAGNHTIVVTPLWK